MRLLIPLALLCAAAATAGCAHRGPSTVRDLQRDLRQLEGLERRGKADGPALARLAGLTYLALNDREAEADLLARAHEAAPEDTTVLWRLARTASRDRRFPELLDAATALLEANPNGVYTELAWRLVVANLGQMDGLPEVVDGWIGAGGPPQSANPCTREALLGLVQQRLAARGDRDAAVAVISELGYLTSWQLAGPAGDDPAGDLTWLAPLPRADAVPANAEIGRVHLNPARLGGGVYDAWTTLQVDGAGPWLFTVGATTSARLDVDGQVLVERDRWDAHLGRRTHGTIELSEGEHVVHLRLAVDSVRGSFSVRAVPHPLGDGAAAVTANLEAPPGTAIPVLRSGASDPETRLDLVLAEALASAAFHGRSDAQALAQELPWSAEVRRRAGLSLLSDTSLVDAARSPAGTRHLEAALDLDPELAGVAVSLARRVRSRDRDGAREMLLGVVARRPDLVEAHLELVNGFEELGWNVEADATLEAARHLAPDRPSLLKDAYHARVARGEHGAARPLAEAALAGLGTPLNRDRADLLEDLGRLEEAAADLADLARFEPGDVSLWQDRIRLARALADLEGARALARDAAARFPHRAWPHAHLADMALVDGIEPAAAHLRTALAVEPADLNLRMQLWRLTGDRSAWLSGDPAPVDYDPSAPEQVVRTAIAAFEAEPGDTAAYPAVYLLDRREVQLFTGGASIFRLHRVARLQNRAAVDAYAEVTPGSMEVLAARTWRTDGTPVDADPPVEKDAYSLRDLTPGCTLEVQALSGADADAGGTDGAYVGPAVMLGAGDEYTVRGELIYLLPPDTRYELRGTAPPPEVQELPDGGRRLRWVTRDTPPLVPEPYAPSGEEYRPWIQLLAWTDLEESLGPVVAHQRASIRRAPEVEALADSLARGQSPEEATRRVVEHVRREIRPPGNRSEVVAEAVDILAMGAGAHETAVLAVLRASGMTVDRVAVRPTYLPPLGDAPRLAGDYPATLLRVVGDRGDLWLDLGDPYIPVGWLPPWLRDAELVPLGEPAAPLPERTPAPSGRLPGLRATLDLSVDDAGDAQGTLQLAFFRQNDGLMREELWSIPEADRLQSFEGWLTEVLPGISVLAADAEHRADPDLPLEVTLTIQVPHLFRVRGDDLEANLFLPDILPPIDGQSPMMTSLVLGGDRTTPLLVWPYHESLTVRLRGPGVVGRTLEGWSPLSVRTAAVDLSRSSRRDRRDLVLERQTTFRAGRIAADEYPDLRTLVAAAVSSGRNPLRLIAE